jgi:hypothetical protein
MGIVLDSDNIDDCVERLSQFNRAQFLNADMMHQEMKELYSYESVCNELTKCFTSN